MTESPRAAPATGKDGFRIRGTEVTRVEALSDGVFALAMTLLVVSVEAPSSVEKLIEIVKGFPAFGVCFAILIWIWYRHYKFCRWYGLQDVPTIILNSVLLFLVLFYVYPLKYIYVVFIGGLTGLQNSQITPLDGRWLFVIFGLGSASVFLVFGLLHSHALRVRAKLELDAREIFETRAEVADNLWLAAVGALSAVLALTLPDRWLGFAGWSYFLIGVEQTICGIYHGRKRHEKFGVR